MKFSGFSRRVAIVALGAALVTTNVLPVAQADGPRAVTGGVFSWGVKASFLGYVSGPAGGGVVEGKEGATYEGGQFHLPVDVDDAVIDASGNGTLPLEGEAIIKAHKGLGKDGGWGLDLRYDDFLLTVEGATATLTADFELTGVAGRGGGNFLDRSGDDVTLVTMTFDKPLNPKQALNTLVAAETVVEQGVTDSLLNYKPGQELDGADLVVEFSDAAAPAPTRKSSSFLGSSW